ncbi:MAG: hypothetical protein ACRD0N_05760 [Acidimicrobiales bacterium]
MAHDETTSGRTGAAAVAVAPLVLLLAFALHPHIGSGFPDQDAVGAAVAEQTTRWGLAHLAAGVASGAMALAFLAIRARLRGTRGDHWSARGVPLVVMGSTLYTFLPGMEFAPLAAAESGGDVTAAAEALVAWFVPIHVIGSLAFGAGVLAFAKAICDSAMFTTRRERLVVIALAVMVVARLAPVVAVQFYVQPAASLIALWSLAQEMWKVPSSRLPTESNPVPAV